MTWEAKPCCHDPAVTLDELEALWDAFAEVARRSREDPDLPASSRRWPRGSTAWIQGAHAAWVTSILTRSLVGRRWMFGTTNDDQCAQILRLSLTQWLTKALGLSPTLESWTAVLAKFQQMFAASPSHALAVDEPLPTEPAAPAARHLPPQPMSALAMLNY